MGKKILNIIAVNWYQLNIGAITGLFPIKALVSLQLTDSVLVWMPIGQSVCHSRELACNRVCLSDCVSISIFVSSSLLVRLSACLRVCPSLYMVSLSLCVCVCVCVCMRACVHVLVCTRSLRNNAKGSQNQTIRLEPRQNRQAIMPRQKSTLQRWKNLALFSATTICGGERADLGMLNQFEQYSDFWLQWTKIWKDMERWWRTGKKYLKQEEGEKRSFRKAACRWPTEGSERADLAVPMSIEGKSNTGLDCKFANSFAAAKTRGSLSLQHWVCYCHTEFATVTLSLLV